MSTTQQKDLEDILNDVGIPYESEESKKRPSRALVAFGRVPGYRSADLPVVLEGTADVEASIADTCSCLATDVGIIDYRDGDWILDAPFEGDPHGLMIWEGNIANPAENFKWRRLRPGELILLEQGKYLFA